MSTVLYIKASPRGNRSYSVATADAFVEAYRESHPGDEIVTLDLFTEDLPTFDGLALDAKYVILHGQEHTQEQLGAWKAVEKVIEQFKSADKYVLATPMWNFSIPYRLKQYIDILVQPTYTFNASPEGYTGLVTGKPMVVCYARGGEYPPGTDFEAYDFQTKYIQLIMGFMGITDIRSFIVEPTLMKGPDAANEAREATIKKAREAAKDF
jgi:FMN-dependent NADH-azoreductase